MEGVGVGWDGKGGGRRASWARLSLSLSPKRGGPAAAGVEPIGFTADSQSNNPVNSTFKDPKPHSPTHSLTNPFN